MKHFLLIYVSMSVLTGCMVEMLEDPVLPDVVYKNTESIRTRSRGSMSYYWYKDEKVDLPVADSYFAVFRSSSLNGISKLSSLNAGLEFKYYDFQASSTRLGAEEKYLWAKIDADIASAYSDEIVYLAPYLVGSSNELGVTERFYVKLKSEKDYYILKDFAAENGVEIVNENFIPLWYSLVCTEQATENALTLSNLAYETGKFDMTDIEFMGDFSWDIIDYPYDDPFFYDQWNLHGQFGINIEDTHTITFGSGSVIVAVIDSGTLLDHPDLPIHMSWDAISRTSPCQMYYIHNTVDIHPHGTQMASIIGSTPDNDIGIAGIAPGISLLPISIGPEPESDKVCTAIYYAAGVGADVISNSYSFKQPHSAISNAFGDALEMGCVLVQSSGNLNTTNPAYPYASIPEIISVGNITREGMRWVGPAPSLAGSTYGQNLDVVAPGTDIMSLKPTGEYVACTGTSPACPHVAATAALMLSVNQNLTPQKVSEIIEVTARKLPSYIFGVNTSRPNGKWNSEVGYGLVSPVDALSLAQGYYNLASFDYSGQNITLTLTANKNISIIWDWETKDITDVSITSPTTRTIEHTYNISKPRRIYIVEKIDLDTDTLSYASNALTKFDLPTGNHASNFEFKPYNTALEYIRIIGGSNFASQTVSIKELPALRDLYLVHMPNAIVTITHCPSLLRFGSSKYIWEASSSIFPFPITPIHPGFENPLDPDVVGDGPVDKIEWPYVPEPIVSYGELSITDCNQLMEVSLENVNIGSFDFSDFPYLEYVYVSSQSHRIVGGGSNVLSPSCNGEFLASTVSTLPQRTINRKGKIAVRGVDSTNGLFKKAWISSLNQNLIEDTCDSKNWDVIWDSGITNTGL